MKPVAYVLFAVLLAGVQAALLRWAGGGAVSVCLLAACVVHLGLTAGNVDGALGAAGVGYVLDVVGGTPLGLMTFLSVAVFLLARAAGAAVDVRGRIAFAALSGLAAFTLSAGALLLLRFVSPAELEPGFVLLPRMLVEAAITALLAPVVLVGLRRLDRMFHREEPGLLR